MSESNVFIVILKNHNRMIAGHASLLNTRYRVLFAVFIISLPFTNAFAWHLWLPIPLILIFTFFLFSFVDLLYFGRLPNPFKSLENKLILAFLFSLSIASLINSDTFGEEQLNHLLSYAIVIGSYYFGSMALVWKAKVSLNTIIIWVTLAVLIASVFGIVEFAGKNIFGYDIDSLIFRNTDTEYNPIYADVFIRARSLMSESGNFALFLELLSPIVIFHWIGMRKWMRCGILLCVFIVALITTFSAAAVAGLSLGVMIALILYVVTVIARMKLSHRGLLTVFLSSLGIIVLVIVVIQNVDSDYVIGIASKLTFSNSSVDSPESRLSRWYAVLPIIHTYPFFGIGAGGFLGPYGIGQGIVSWWLQLIVEGGFISFVLFLAFYVTIFIKALRINSNRRYSYIISLCAGGVHYAVISDYWLPWIWFLFVLIVLESGQTKMQRFRAVVCKSGRSPTIVETYDTKYSNGKLTVRSQNI